MNNNKSIFHMSALATCIAAAMSQQVVAEEAKAEKGIERINVTGSNIFKGSVNFTSSSPVVEVGKESIEGIGAISISNTLSRLPSVTAGTNDASNNHDGGGSSGISTTSLRNLGTARTLVLVNGRRYVSGTSAGDGYGVDLNSIPTSIIERVDVLTGGQSAIYGSDAIAGVVNIITKKNFDGVEINAFGADSDAGGAARQNIDFTYGKNFDGGNAWVSLGLANQDNLNARDREFSRNSINVLDDDGDGLRETLHVRNGPMHVDEGAFKFGDLSIFGNGDLFSQNAPTITSDGQLNGESDFYNQTYYRKAIAPYTRQFAAAGMTFDISDKLFADLEINYSEVNSSTNIETAPLSVVNDVFVVNRGGTTGIDVANSPFFNGSSAQSQLLPYLLNSGDGSTSLDRVETFRRLAEFDNLGVENRRTTFRIAGSLDYELDSGLLWSTSAVYGTTTQVQKNTGDVNLVALRSALNIEEDGNGGYQCADVTDRWQGCVPVNPFGTVDSELGQAGIVGFSDEAVDYISVDTGQNGVIKQYVVNSALSGELPFTLNDENLSFAAGIEYRREEGAETPDAFRQAGITRRLQVFPTKGSFYSYEAFGELFVPVADWLSVSLALRAGDYSSIGSTSTYRFGLDAPVNDYVRFRASVSSAVRAPNVNDLYSSGSASATGGHDVCDGVDASTTGNIAENCRSIAAISNRIDSTGAFTLVGSESQNERFLQTGSTDLKEETADTYTLGAIFTPVEAFSLSVDYYSIEIEDAILNVGAGEIISRCYDVDPSEFDPTCGGNVVRAVNGPILNITSQAINESEVRTSGVDIEAYYTYEGFDLSLSASYLDEYVTTSAAGVERDYKGEVLYPEFRYTLQSTYSLTDDISLFAQLTYRDETQNDVNNDVNQTLSDDINTLDSVYYLDVRASYNVTDSLNVYVGTNNLFDEQPDIIPRLTVTGSAAGTNTEPRAYDIIGRQFFAGMKLKF
ncbi:TonB-dependent receptor domain-containing protein [Pseudoalteromonas shioyasakiensis]|uniref:TonB-dependent receptor domain-containing protein n=1 Tax=Pseudoalteromonas shioyasakiensis TaxID=1190813 RepID=UPI002551F30F|nr:TonB-dependent receptor [Pseudoalteromonas shioyasakiensis]MDK9685828.1 TonB-dependent receptor [Pseudoalteromonas shioyasakiensis]